MPDQSQICENRDGNHNDGYLTISNPGDILKEIHLVWRSLDVGDLLIPTKDKKLVEVGNASCVQENLVRLTIGSIIE